MSDPSSAEFWNSRYLSGKTPWDFGGVPADVKAYLRRKTKYPSLPGTTRGKVLIPGCGTGYEIKAFVDAGFEVTAIDLAPAAVDRAKVLVGPWSSDRVLLGDFFAQPFAPASFDFVYERTFLCALDPGRRTAYRDRVAQLLAHGGALIGYFYYDKTDPAEGPPHGLAWGEGDALFSHHFLLMKDDPVGDSLPVFAGHERWQERRRTSKPV